MTVVDAPPCIVMWTDAAARATMDVHRAALGATAQALREVRLDAAAPAAGLAPLRRAPAAGDAPAYLVRGPYRSASPRGAFRGAVAATLYHEVGPGQRAAFARLLAVKAADADADADGAPRAKRARIDRGFDDAGLETHWAAIRDAPDLRALWRGTVTEPDPVAQGAEAGRGGEIDGNSFLPDAVVNAYVFRAWRGAGPRRARAPGDGRS
jgi:hypothetical protein